MREKTLKLRIVFALIVFINFTLLFLLLSIIFNLTNLSYGSNEQNLGFTPGSFRFILLFACFSIGMALERFVNRKIFKPITLLNDSLDEVSKGNFTLKLNNKSRIKEIRKMMTHYNNMTDELASIEMFRSDFINSVSHEFKTPLAAIEGYATLLQDENLTFDERQNYTSYIINSTKRLTNLSSNILKLSRLENQEILLEKTTFNLAEQIRTVILTLERDWAEKNHELEIELDELNYHGNQDLLFQVWLNLIYNAIKFTPEAGIIKISLTKENEQIVMSVTDNGIGISPESRKRIFEKFYQSDKSHNSNGNGLGLALVRRIVHLHEGIINAYSAVNVGSTFTVKFLSTRVL